ncbi:hypothetical protein BU16DRAFT_577717 [Lophium mytilinum]|uniref:Uncharacterized protein n=1 Tax=Lophium mytilinum TaxID=390894 RepID=A0A6A6RB15_9PEZI|nr:hypothetical protein BU16DRAFT_577717 [Lophium mytilinum]
MSAYTPHPSPKKRATSAPDLDFGMLAFTESRVLATDNTRSFSDAQTCVPSSTVSTDEHEEEEADDARDAPSPIKQHEHLLADGHTTDWRHVFASKPPKLPDAMSERAAGGWIDIHSIRTLLPAPVRARNGEAARAKLHMVRHGSDRLETLEVVADRDHLYISSTVGRRGRDYWLYSLKRDGKVRVWYRELHGMVTIILSAPDGKGCCDFRAPKKCEPYAFAPFLRILADRIHTLADISQDDSE